MRILLTGANGQVGRCLRAQKPEDWEMIAADSATLDITDSAAITGMVQNFEPDVIINAAGYTNLEAAECTPTKCSPSTPLACATLPAPPPMPASA